MDYKSILRYFYGDEIVFEEALSSVYLYHSLEIHYRPDSAENMLKLYNINNAISNSYPCYSKIKKMVFMEYNC
ncbi:MAG: hypothetical protein U0Z74_03275 [Romboutsia timonensis]